MNAKRYGSGREGDMPHERRMFGDSGEALALAYFELRGYRIVERNWLCRLGEIDLILERRSELHFVEVKTRRSLTYGYPEESITGKKLRHLARTIEVYLSRHAHIPDRVHVHALAITIIPGQPPEYYLIENIL